MPCDNELSILWRPAEHPTGTDSAVTLTVMLGERVLAVDEVRIINSRERERFVDTLCSGRPGIDREAVGARLLEIAGRQTRQGAMIPPPVSSTKPPCAPPRADETAHGALRTGVLSASALSTQVRSAPYQAFPTEALPTPIASFIREAAEAIGCDESFVALPLLVGFAAAVGNTRRVQVKWDWVEPCVLWAAVVARSGQRKSPPLDVAVAGLREMQAEALEEHREAMERYAAALREWKAASRSGGAAGEEPRRPALRRWLVVDSTVEALAVLLEENPRGLAMVRDELSGWFSGFNQYKSGKGSDASQYLEMHRAGSVTVDRRTGERRTIYVPRAALNIAGTIQPEVLRRCLGSEHFESGLAARLLLCMPPAQQRRWTDKHIQPHTRERVADVYRRLAELRFDPAGQPRDLPVTPEAQAIFAQFVDEHGAEQASLGDEALESAWSKLEGYAARMALVVQMVRWALGQDEGERVDLTSVRTGILLARWFGNEARRVYGAMRRGEAEKDLSELIERVEKTGGIITPRDLCRACRKYPSAGAAEAALQTLVDAGVGEWTFHSPEAEGGRPSKRFKLSTCDPRMSADVDETPSGEAAAGVLSARVVEIGSSVARDSREEQDDYDAMERAAMADPATH